jgi:hypothetical protein
LAEAALPQLTSEAGDSRKRPVSRLPLRVFVGIVLAAQLLGGAIGVAILLRGAPAEAATIGKAVVTSYGVMSVDQIEEIAASNPDRDTLVPGLREIQVAITMTNVLHRPILYSRRQVSLRVAGAAGTIPVSSASIFAGRLKAGTAFRAVYRFDIPSAAADLWVRYDDPGRTAPIWIDLGSGPIPVGVSSAYNIHLHYFSPHKYGGSR